MPRHSATIARDPAERSNGRPHAPLSVAVELIMDAENAVYAEIDEAQSSANYHASRFRHERARIEQLQGRLSGLRGIASTLEALRRRHAAA